jgi:hypothetical protein
VPALPVGEDVALERDLRAAGVRITYPRGVRVTTSARPGGRMTRATEALAAVTAGTTPLVVQAPAGRRGAAVRDALASLDGGDLVVVLPEALTDPDAVAEALAAPLLSDDHLVLVKAVAPVAHPLDDVLARPLLELHAPALTAVRSPMAPAWAARRSALAELVLPADDAVDIAVLVDLWRVHGLPAIAQVPVDLPAPAVGEPGTLAYAVLATVGERARARGERPRPDLEQRVTWSSRPGRSVPAW